MAQTFNSQTVRLFREAGVPIDGNEWAAEKVQSALVNSQAKASALGRSLTKRHLRYTQELEVQIVAALLNEVKAGTLKVTTRES